MSLGPMVVIAGPDGAGKTAVAEELVERTLSRPVLHLHHRPGVLPAKTRHEGPVTEPHAGVPYPRWASLLKLLYLFCDHHAGWWTSLRRVRRRGGSVVMERGWADLTVDLRRYRLDAPAWFVRLLTRLVPRPDLTLVLVADPDVLMARKAELPAAELGRQVEAWRAYARADDRAVLVDVGQPLPEVLAAVRAAVSPLIARAGA